MKVLGLVAITIALWQTGCFPAAPLQPVEVRTTNEAVSYFEDGQPILDRRCAVCHSCYNAPCQLDLTSFEGLDRGATKDPVYSPARLEPLPPTRLFVDGSDTAGWRSRGFASVTSSTAQGSYNDSLMLELLAAKMGRPELPPGSTFHPEAEDLTCPVDGAELGSFLASHPDSGMPFGFPPLESSEYDTLASWLQQGAAGPAVDAHAQRAAPSAASMGEIQKWERFLNTRDPKHAMTARYLYEHFFLAHLNFPDGDPGEFYSLVRSHDPPGAAINGEIATVRPYDDPGDTPFYYRFRKIHSTIVYKTHMVVEFSDATLARYRELFIEPDWNVEPHLVGYDEKTGANPFVIYAQIPPDARYRFLLDHSEYVIRTFIRGPVCKGQVALNVIHDHFWLFFLDPESDLTTKNPAFLSEQSENLRLPNEKGSEERLLRTFSDRYRKRYSAFYSAKSAMYDQRMPDGFGLDAIWKGRRAQDSPVLTVYRHFDSASVHRGALGDLPRTAWVIDYPQFERIYYALVAGFDVFGNLSHQVNVRRYMDYLRIEGELNFLEFLPRESRLPILKSWYRGDGAIHNVDHEGVLSQRDAKIPFETSDPKRELIERVIEDHVLESVGVGFDPINYPRDGIAVAMPARFDTHEHILDGFRALTVPGTDFIRHQTSSAVNLLYVRVRDYQGEDRFFSIVINRWHDNVNSMFREAGTLDASRDTMDFILGQIGAYPNYFLDLAADEVPEFFDMLQNFEQTEPYLAKMRKFGVNRADPDFWQTYDWFQQRVDEADPLTAGLLDLNRYYPVARAD